MAKRKPKKFEFASGPRILTRGNFVGFCDMRDEALPLYIWVDPKIKGAEELRVFIHEALHAEFPEMSEEEIVDRASRLATWLYDAAGYRIKEKKRAKPTRRPRKGNS